jgi:2-polyprenyl-3-methyl-5-hydroxy-6-metoxy-1,4-benzoquinol methylase
LPAYVQQNQPPGVPPLELTGERTLPDVPEENYWYRRHLVVYRWIAERCRGKRVVDLACGEGYGSAVLAEFASEVVGVDANPDAYEHATLRYSRPGLRFERALVEEFAHPDPFDAVVFLQTIEHVQQPVELLRHIKSLLAAGGAAYISTPNRLTLAPKGAQRSGNPWHVYEYTFDEFHQLVGEVFDDVELVGLFHSGKLRVHELGIRLGWDRIHKALRVTDPFYDRFTPAISERDFKFRHSNLDTALDFLAICRK